MIGHEVFARATPVYPRFTIGVPFPLAESLAKLGLKNSKLAKILPF